MQNTIARALFLLLVTGALFTGCSKQDDSATGNQGQLEESVMGELTEGDTADVEDTTSSTPPDNTTTNGSGTGTTDAGTTDSSSSTPSTTTDAATQTYKDGTYSATGSYSSPAGKDTMGVTLVLKGDVVTAVTITPKSSNETSRAFQEMFAQNVSAVVVGKPLSSLGSLGAVNGASLTPIGFNAAVASIKGLAQ